jgi:PEP-CTERM motif
MSVWVCKQKRWSGGVMNNITLAEHVLGAKAHKAARSVPSCQTVVRTLLVAITFVIGGLITVQAQAYPIATIGITTSGIISSGNDPSNLFGSGPNLAGDAYTLITQYDAFGPSYFFSGSNASDIGDALTGFVTATVNGHSLTTPIVTSLGASLAEDMFSLFATNVGFDAGGDLVDVSQSVTSSAAFISRPTLLSSFAYTLSSSDMISSSDSYTYNNAAFTVAASFIGTPSSIEYAVVPEPASIAVLLAGLLGIVTVRRRQRTS